MKKKIKNLNKMVLGHVHILIGQSYYNQGGVHDILFLLKSLDLDLKMGYPLRTVFGYDMEKILKDDN